MEVSEEPALKEINLSCILRCLSDLNAVWDSFRFFWRGVFHFKVSSTVRRFLICRFIRFWPGSPIHHPRLAWFELLSDQQCVWSPVTRAPLISARCWCVYAAVTRGQTWEGGVSVDISPPLTVYSCQSSTTRRACFLGHFCPGTGDPCLSASANTEQRRRSRRVNWLYGLINHVALCLWPLRCVCVTDRKSHSRISLSEWEQRSRVSFSLLNTDTKSSCTLTPDQCSYCVKLCESGASELVILGSKSFRNKAVFWFLSKNHCITHRYSHNVPPHCWNSPVHGSVQALVILSWHHSSFKKVQRSSGMSENKG